MKSKNRGCPRCDSKDLKSTYKRESMVIEDWPHNRTFEVIYYFCKTCDLIFGEKI